MKKTITADSIGALPKVAEAIIAELPSHNVVAFYGPMGAGKTTLIREICDRLGVEDNVTSPTFALVNEYHDAGDRAIYHFDFYRIEKIDEAYDMGYEEYFYSGGTCLVEWPERITGLLPENTIEVFIEITGDHSRTFTLSAEK